MAALAAAYPWILRVAAISGASSVALGAYGAHKFRTEDPHFQEVFRRANHYHMMHSLLLAIAPVARKPPIVAGLAALGITLFSGSLYTVAFTQDRSWGKFAPYGGFSLIFAWLALAL